jgi:hypothetical protein
LSETSRSGGAPSSVSTGSSHRQRNARWSKHLSGFNLSLRAIGTVLRSNDEPSGPCLPGAPSQSNVCLQKAWLQCSPTRIDPERTSEAIDSALESDR